jgi:hypothetical protein
MKTQKNNREVSVGNQRRMYLPGKVEILPWDLQAELFVLTEISLALGHEIDRLEVLKKGKKVPRDEVRLTYALLEVLSGEFSQVRKAIDRALSSLDDRVVEKGLSPMFAGTWAGSDSRPTTKAGRAKT